MPGLLITFEGIDGCGKGTQIELLVEAIQREGWGDRVVLTKQPGGTALGNVIRDILFKTITTHKLEPDAASLLFFASHVQALAEIVYPALKAGKIVIADRWCAYSDVAFGLHGLARPIHQSLVDFRRALGGPEPDLLFFMHGDPQTLLERATGRTTESHESGKRWAKVDTITRIQEEYFRIFDGMMDTKVPSPLRAVRADHRTAPMIFGQEVWPAVFATVRRHFDLD